jgi:hypothetical protein
MSYEKFYGDSESFFGWRCIACGEIIDEVILEKRSLKKRLMGKKEIGQVGEF